jgi:exonuclease SbcC
MQFVKLQLKNFISHKDTTIDFKDHGLNLIEGINEDDGGSNGAGKSTLWDGISFCLFGETIGETPKKGDDVIHRKFGKNCSVRLTLNKGEDEYEIVRSRKPNDLYFRKNGKETKLGSLAATQKRIIEEFGVDIDLFKTTVLFAQGEAFNFANETDKKQKEILGKIVKISFEDVLRKAKAKFSEIHDAISSVDTKVSRLEYGKEQKQEELDGYKKYSESFEETKKQELQKLISRKQQAQEDIKERQMQGVIIPKLKAVSEKLDAKVEEVEAKLTDIKDKRSRAIARRSVLRADIKTKEEVEPVCSKCGSEVDVTVVKKDIIEMTETVDKVDTLIKKLNPMELDGELFKYKTKLKEVNRNIMVVEAQQSEIKVLEDQIAKADEDIDLENDKENNWEEQIKETKTKLQEIDFAVAAIQDSVTENREELPYWQFWINGFGEAGIKSFIFDTLCGQLTAKANKYIDTLSNGSVSISFDTQTKLKSGEIREKFEVSVIKEGVAEPYRLFSGGEKRRISLSVDMALADLMKDFYGSDFNMIVFDEQTNFMDREGRSCFMKLLREQARSKNVYVVDHDAEFKSKFDNTLLIKKKDGISEVCH